MLSIRLNLLRLASSGLVNLTGKNGIEKKCLVIPVEDANLFVGKEGIYLDLTAFELHEKRFEQTHLVKQSINKEVYSSMTDEQKNAMPIIGGIKEFERQEVQASNDYSVPPDQPDDLPF